MTDTLAEIVAARKAAVMTAQRTLPWREIEARADLASPPRGFAAALRRARADGDYGLIAEIKQASPSRGLIRADFDVTRLANAYLDGGATCLSVLTEPDWFRGADAHLVTARNAVPLPVLRKDFMVDAYQIVEARALGADCVLLILAALSDGQAEELEAAALGLGMDVLVEVHDAAERDRALRLRSRMMGINNRNLKTLQVDIGTAAEVARGVADDYLLVGESGLSTPADLARLAGAGITTFLVGEALMREDDVAAATRALLARTA